MTEASFRAPLHRTGVPRASRPAALATTSTPLPTDAR